MKKILTVILAIITVVLVCINIPYIMTAITSDKLTCKSKEGNITLIYNDTVEYFFTDNIYYNLDNQKAMIEKVGINNYIDYFSNWFNSNTSGKCVK